MLADVKVWPAIAVDVIAVVVFAIVGRSSHGETNDLLGVAVTAWPFLVGCLIGLVGARAWQLLPTDVAQARRRGDHLVAAGSST